MAGVFVFQMRQDIIERGDAGVRLEEEVSIALQLRERYIGEGRKQLLCFRFGRQVPTSSYADKLCNGNRRARSRDYIAKNGAQSIAAIYLPNENIWGQIGVVFHTFPTGLHQRNVVVVQVLEEAQFFAAVVVILQGLNLQKGRYSRNDGPSSSNLFKCKFLKQFETHKIKNGCKYRSGRIGGKIRRNFFLIRWWRRLAGNGWNQS